MQHRPIPPKLREAHQLFASGKFQEAAELYLMLAEKASVRSIPQTPNLYLRAAAALIKAEDYDKAKVILIKGFEWLLKRKKWVQIKKSFDVAIARMRDNNNKELAEFLQAWINKNIPDEVKRSASWIGAGTMRKESLHLPSNCSNCGGPVNPKEVEWYDATTAICSYCGCVIN
ncbi:MAG: hypothetical protein J7L66_05655 [Anaerolineaceae bacterium]|nr:hypothetical protein [Anaerolineaceae bacterium]